MRFFQFAILFVLSFAFSRLTMAADNMPSPEQRAKIDAMMAQSAKAIQDLDTDHDGNLSDEEVSKLAQDAGIEQDDASEEEGDNYENNYTKQSNSNAPRINETKPYVAGGSAPSAPTSIPPAVGIPPVNSSQIIKK